MNVRIIYTCDRCQKKISGSDFGEVRYKDKERTEAWTSLCSDCVKEIDHEG